MQEIFWWKRWRITYIDDWRRSLITMGVNALMFLALTVWFALGMPGLAQPTTTRFPVLGIVVLPAFMCVHMLMNTIRIAQYARRQRQVESKFEGAFAFDPRVLYDPSASRYFAVSVDNLRLDNNFVVAVSDSQDPTAGWHGFQIDADPQNIRWADFPMLGHNGDFLVVAANMFAQTGQSAASSLSALVFPKADLLAAVPTDGNTILVEGIDPFADTGFSLQPVVDRSQHAGGLPMLGADRKSNGSLRRSDLTVNLGVAAVVPGPLISVTSRSATGDADQPGPKRNIRTDDSRFSGNVVRQDDSLWAVHNVRVNGRSAVEWYRISTSNDQVLGSGLIEDPQLEFYYPSIAVNDLGDVVIGFSGSSASQFVSSYVAVGQAPATGPIDFGPPTLVKAGVADYEVLDTSGRNRWGGYSATVEDPLNPKSFWTFQEYVSAQDVWSVQITHIIVPEPAVGIALLWPLCCVLLGRRRGEGS